MKYRILTEQQLKESAEGRLERLFEIWHRDLVELRGEDLTIVLGSRRDSSSPVRGGILTNSVIEMDGSEKRLIIWYDPLELYYEARIAESGYTAGVVSEITELLRFDQDPGAEYDPVLNPDKLDYDNIARQVGRWLLRIRGFKRLRNERKEYSELDAFLNAECIIPALYSLFDEAEFDYSRGEEKRLREVLEGLSNMEEPSKRLDRALNALRIANLLSYCGDNNPAADGLRALLKERFPGISAACTEIEELKKGYNLKEAESLYSFMSSLVLKFRMPGSWVSFDETIGIF